MRLTKDALQGALKNVQRLWQEALVNEDKAEIARWGVERSRILSMIISYDEETNNG